LVVVQLDSGLLLAPGERQQEALLLAHKNRRPTIGDEQVGCEVRPETRIRFARVAASTTS